MLEKTSVDGLILIDKAEGITSYDVIRKIKKILKDLNIKTKIGHAGTLDPFATGLLVVLLGRYTRLSDYIMDASKVYSGIVDIGNATDTGDLTGNVIESKDVSVEDVDNLIINSKDYIGDFMQTPPQYSALKHKGKPLYEYARKGEFVHKDPRPIKVTSFEMKKEDDQVTFKTEVSKGTYVRTLVEDYCKEYGIPANLKSLRRESSGSLNLEKAIGIDELNADNFYQSILKIDDIKTSYEKIDLDRDSVDKLYNGIRIESSLEDQGPLLLSNEGKVFALGEIREGLIRTICFLGDK
ncbi:tRNA pseudouridine(55) synthase TruB [Ezakiella peruensis]|uniref:tRNA pseudouridine(55) synthase TruB n=1 Tax=Ezakiella peruensis TaxID=1464038 RepID=UPI000C1B3178|nr:tRNA pseudouridine(55) synthase TruB [Ezakiella peruensis]